MADVPTRIELLEFDIDIRLRDLWTELWEDAQENDWSDEHIEAMGAYMRAAYGKAYCDALVEENPGHLCTDHGYPLPERRRTESKPNPVSNDI